MKEVLCLAAELLGLGQAVVDAEGHESETERLLLAANLCYDEIAGEYLPLIATEKVSVSSGFIPFASLNKRCQSVCAVTDEQGEKMRFRVRADGVFVKGTSVSVTYRYLPEPAASSAVALDFDEGRLPPRVIAYGTAAEYSLIEGFYQEAVLWEKRYRDSLLALTGRKTALRLPQRRWA